MPVPSLHSKNVAAVVIPPPVVPPPPPGAPPPPPASVGIGEQIVFTDDIAFLTDPGNVIGHHSGFCTRVRGGTPGNTNRYQCEATFRLPGGQLTARGVVDLPRPAGQTDPFAISGGTGAYDNIRGEVRVTKISDTEADYEFDTHGA